MGTKRFLAVLLAIVIATCIFPFTASAADPEILNIDGERIALVSSFGKMTYEGKSYVTYRNFNDALNALGKEGGKIIFAGTAQLGAFEDIEGRGDITVQGIGTKSQGNLLDFTGTEEAPVSEVNLKGNIILDFVNIRMDEGAFLLTNGYSFETYNDFDTYHTEKYVAGSSNIIEYPNPPSIAPGQTDGTLGTVVLSSGTYTTVAAGSVNGHNVNGDTFVTVDGGNISNVVAGNIGAGTMNGDANLTVSGGNITKLVAGSSGGTINGNVITEINGGEISEAIIGAEAGAVINGSIVVALNGGNFASDIGTGSGQITGKKIVITGEDTVANIADGAADYVIKISGGLCEPQFNGAEVTGFLFTDNYGIPAKTITLNGAETTSENGIYQITEGTSSISLKTDVTVAINKNANYVAGYDDGTFLPQNNMTKAEAITLLSRLVIDENIIKGNVTSTFKDVEPGSWYESYIGFFQKLGFLDLVADRTGTRISPNENITRGEFTQLIYEIATIGSEETSVKLTSVKDVDAKNPYRAAIHYAMSSGIVVGYEDGTFRPDNNITRAEVVTMVNRFLGRVPTGQAGENSFSDISEHWAASQILAACNPEGTSWTYQESATEYVLSGTSAKDYTVGLYEQSATLSAEAIRNGIDTISEQMKKDILNTPNTADIYGDRMTGDTYYVSEKNGDDSNDGKSPETAVKTIAGLYQKIRFPRAGTAVLFERGGIYRGQISAQTGLVFGSYGEGSKPLLMQSKRNYADESLWVETEWPNVWKCTEKLNNVGVIGFDHDLFDYSDASYSELYGEIMNTDLFGFSGVQDLNKDLQFYSVLSNDKSNSDSVKEGDLYVYSTGGNPGARFSSIEIGENVAIFSGPGDDVVIDNLAFKFTGGHGMGGAGGCKNRTVTNCVYSWLGGSVLAIDFRGSGSPVNYGNAVEIYGSCNGYHVENNWMYQIYDTGVTHQFSDGTACTQEGVRYYGNLIEYCHWGIEFYNSPGDGSVSVDPSRKYTRDVISAYNVIRNTGYGWGSITRYRTTGSFAYCGSSLSLNEDEHTIYNIFDRGAGYLVYLPSNSNEEDDKNIYVQTVGNRLGLLKGVYRDCDYNAAEYIKEDLGDKNAVVIVIE